MQRPLHKLLFYGTAVLLIGSCRSARRGIAEPISNDRVQNPVGTGPTVNPRINPNEPQSIKISSLSADGKLPLLWIPDRAGGGRPFERGSEEFNKQFGEAAALVMDQAWQEAGQILQDASFADKINRSLKDDIKITAINLVKNDLMQVDASGNITIGGKPGQGNNGQNLFKFDSTFENSGLSFTMSVHFLKKTESGDVPVVFKTEPLHLWWMKVGLNGMTNLKPSNFAGALLKLPEAVRKAVGALIDNIGSIGINMQFNRESEWIAEAKTKSIYSEVTKSYMSQLSYEIAEKIFASLCRDVQGGAENTCDLKEIDYSSNEQIKAYRIMDVTSCDYLGLEGAMYFFKAPLVEKDQIDYLADSSRVYLYKQSSVDSYGKFKNNGEYLEVLDTEADKSKCLMTTADEAKFRCVKSRHTSGIHYCPNRSFTKLKMSVVEGSEFAYNE